MSTKSKLEQVSIVILLIWGLAALLDIFALDTLDLLVAVAAFSVIYYFGYQKVKVNKYGTAQACFTGLAIDAGGFFVYGWVLGNILGMAFYLVLLLAGVYAVGLTYDIRRQTKIASEPRSLN